MLDLPIETKSRILEAHLELIKIFFEANDLKDVYINVYKETYFDGTENEETYRMLSFSFYQETETAEKITYMAMRHAGFLNMLYDYLLKCNLNIFDIEPDPERDKNVKEQARRTKKLEEEQQERKRNLDKDFEEHMKKIGLR